MEMQYRTVILGNSLVFRNPNVCLLISKSTLVQPYNGCFLRKQVIHIKKYADMYEYVLLMFNNVDTKDNIGYVSIYMKFWKGKTEKKETN